MITLWKRFWHYITVKNAIKQANRMKTLTGKKQYVIKIFNHVMVYDRIQINYLITVGTLHKKLEKAYHLDKICIYHT